MSNRPKDFADAFEAARRESLTAFGSPEIFVEKFIARARHIEVQLLGDSTAISCTCCERDCSVQRRHQKVVEIAPAPNLPTEGPQTALRRGGRRSAARSSYDNAGTVEFLVDADTNEFYFIEVNPRIQVEHTVTEEVTGIDIVRSQILIAQGERARRSGDRPRRRKSEIAHERLCDPVPRDDRRPGEQLHARLRPRHALSLGGRHGHPARRAARPSRGAVVIPFYDSLLVKVTAWGRSFRDAVGRMERCLQEFRIRGVKTNIPFLIQSDHASDVPRRRLHDAVHRRDAGAVRVRAAARSRHASCCSTSAT